MKTLKDTFLTILRSLMVVAFLLLCLPNAVWPQSVPGVPVSVPEVMPDRVDFAFDEPVRHDPDAEEPAHSVEIGIFERLKKEAAEKIDFSPETVAFEITQSRQLRDGTGFVRKVRALDQTLAERLALARRLASSA